MLNIGNLFILFAFASDVYVHMKRKRTKKRFALSWNYYFLYLAVIDNTLKYLTSNFYNHQHFYFLLRKSKVTNYTGHEMPIVLLPN